MKKQFKLEDYKGKYVMHCNTEQKANVFLMFLHENGRKWMDGDSYLYKNEFENNKGKTTYNFNNGFFSDVYFYLSRGYEVLSFDDFDFGQETIVAEADSSVLHKIDKYITNISLQYEKTKENLHKLRTMVDNGEYDTEEFKNFYNICEQFLGNDDSDLMLIRMDIQIKRKSKPTRWRAKEDEYYYVINSTGEVVKAQENYLTYDNKTYEIGNYFKTREEAEEKQKQILKVFK